MVLEAYRFHNLKSNTFPLEYADESLQIDKEVVLGAARYSGLSLQFAHYSLSKYREIVLEAVRQNTKAVKFAYKSLQEDRQTMWMCYGKKEI